MRVRGLPCGSRDLYGDVYRVVASGFTENVNVYRVFTSEVPGDLTSMSTVSIPGCLRGIKSKTQCL